MPVKEKPQFTILKEFDAEDLGIPFKVKLIDSVREVINPETGIIDNIIIPNVPGLVKCAALARILEPRKLSGSELKFVRKAFKVPANKLAERIGVSAEHLSRCEAGERVLSTGTEKCLRISLFLHNSKLPEGIEDENQKDEKLVNLLQVYRKAIDRIENILDEMKINSAFPSDEELVLFFKVEQKTDLLFEDLKNIKWCANDEEQPLAA